MAETIYKLQPHRTMHLQGFGGGASVMNGYGCTACLHDASDTGFAITGIWGAQDQFCVLVLWDADNQVEHPRFRYLPDWDCTGISLAFDIEADGCVPIDSDLYPWLDWGTLNVLFKDGTTQQVKLVDHGTPAAGTTAQATATFTLAGVPAAGDYIGLEWTTGYSPAAMWHADYLVSSWDTLDTIVAGIAAAINGGTATYGMSAVADGPAITVTWEGFSGSPLGMGANGNRVGVCATASGSMGAYWDAPARYLTGGSSPSKWTIALDLSTLLTQPAAVQKMWLTFAPDVQGGAFEQRQFGVTVTSWAVTDVSGKRALEVAGPGSVRIEEDSAWVKTSGFWERVNEATATGFGGTAVGWLSQGWAIRAAAAGASVTIETHCGATHDIWLGTRLDGNCGQVQATLDGGAPVTIDCYGGGANVRRKLFSGVAAGQHAVGITLTGAKNASSGGWYFYFDFLECAVPGDVPDAPETRADFGLATDFDTDNAYKLSPARLLWGIQRAGLVGEIDHYMGVFWWPARLQTNSGWAQVTTITFAGTPAFSGTTSVTIGSGSSAVTYTKTNFISDTAESIAKAFEMIITQGSSAFWAHTDGAVLTLTGRAGGASYHLAVAASPASGAFTATAATTDPGATDLEWGVDDAAASPVNAAVAAWHADFFALLEAAGLGVVVSFSDELVAPPDATGAVWVQRFADGSKVETATGFGTLKSSQVAFSAGPMAYMGAAYAQIAALMAAAGLPVRLQFGEVLWWYQSGGSPASMAFYDADTAAAAAAALGRALAAFAGPNDDPAVNAYADANFLRARLKSYVDGVRAAVLAAVPTAVFELLWPMDVDDPDTARLMRYVNLPTEWTVRAGSGWDTFVSEGFQYGGIDRNVDKARRCAAYPFRELGWDQAHSRYLMGWFSSGWPWTSEYRAARATGTAILKGWALDHLFLMGWTLPLPAASQAAAAVQGVLAR